MTPADVDIVDRLRIAWTSCHARVNDERAEAADLIERLRKERDEAMWFRWQAPHPPPAEFAIWIDGTPYTPAGLVEFIRMNIRREVGDIPPNPSPNVPPKEPPATLRFTR